jgi:hypothetical protein
MIFNQKIEGGELLYIKIKHGFALINGTNHNLTILTVDNRAALVKIFKKW